MQNAAIRLLAPCLALILPALGCGHDPDDPPDRGLDAALPDAEPLPEPEIEALAPPPLVRDAFAVAVSASSTIARPGDAITIDARITRVAPPAGLSFTWEAPGAEADTLDGPRITVTFAAPGLHDARVVATDAEGNRVEAGVTVAIVADPPRLIGDVNGDGRLDAADAAAVDAQLANAADLDAAAFARADIDRSGRLDADDRGLLDRAIDDGRGPRVGLPAAGAVGRVVQIISPALLDPGIVVTARVGAAAPITPLRIEPGYAAFAVPPDVGAPGASTVVLEAGGAEIERLAFEIRPTPAASAEPGAKVTRALAGLEDLLGALPPLVDDFLTTIEAPREERAILQGMLRVSVSSLALHRAAFEEAFAEMEPEARAAFEQVALANDLDAALAEIEALRAELDRIGVQAQGLRVGALSAAQGAVLLDVLCAAQGIADVAGQVAEINEIAAGFIETVDTFPINLLPGVGAVIRFLSTISSAIGAITDVIGRVAEFLPEFGELEVTTSAGVLLLGESTDVEASIEIVSFTKLCGQAADAAIAGLVEGLQETLTLRLARSIPFVGSLFRRRDFDRESAGVLAGLVFDVVGELAGAVLDALGVEEGLQSLADRICGLLDDPNVPLGDDVLSSSCGSVAGGRFTCVEACLGSVTFTGETEVCGEQRRGQAAVRCEAPGGGGRCSCETAGSSLSARPDEGGSCFDDAEECSGWASVVIETLLDGDFSEENEAAALSTEVDDGTELCGFGCCITLACP